MNTVKEENQRRAVSWEPRDSSFPKRRSHNLTSAADSSAKMRAHNLPLPWATWKSLLMGQ